MEMLLKEIAAKLNGIRLFKGSNGTLKQHDYFEKVILIMKLQDKKTNVNKLSKVNIKIP